MQRRAFLLFILFAVLAAYYSTTTRHDLSEIAGKQQSQARQLERLDEQVLGPVSGDR